MSLKKVDKLLARSFWPPFLIAFSIAVFVLLMQFVWVWIDDIAGKGASILVITEMIIYMSISLFPMALPIGVLLASVMTMGNLSERYELVSFKSAGVSLWRVMRPLIVICTGVAIFSYICSDFLMPYANLQFKSRLYDISKKKPSLSLEEGVFNKDFSDYVIHFKEMDERDNAIEDVLIYDNRSGQVNSINQMVSKDGAIRPTKDNQFLVMTLNDGHHYQETKRSGYKNTYPFVRTSFKSWEKVFDLREFDMAHTNKDLFKNNESMMSGHQIRTAVDSLEELRKDRIASIEKSIAKYYPMFEGIKIIRDSSRIKADSIAQANKDKTSKSNKKLDGSITDRTLPMPDTTKTLIKVNKVAQAKKKRHPKAIEQDSLRNRVKYDVVGLHYLSEFEKLPTYKKQAVLQRAKSRISTLQSRISTRSRSLAKSMTSKAKHRYELHLKYSFALVCLIFLFIGAPMGAIVRKGGFGYPVLIAISFFMIFIVLTMIFRKLNSSLVVDSFWCAWIPTLAMIPIGVILTQKALNDRKILDINESVTRIQGVFRKLINLKDRVTG